MLRLTHLGVFFAIGILSSCATDPSAGGGAGSAAKPGSAPPSPSPSPSGSVPAKPVSDAGGTDTPSFKDAGIDSAASLCRRDLDMGELSISNAACFVNEHVSDQSTKI